MVLSPVVDLQIYMMLGRQLRILLLVIYTAISKAQNISQCTSSCGGINITFPFRSKADAHNCGDSRFQLDCHNNRTVLILNSRKYNVLEISYHDFLIRAIDPGLENGNSNCTSFPNYFTTEPSTSTFDYSALNIPIIYVNCLVAVNSSRYVETAFCGSHNKNSVHSYVAIGRDMSISDLAEDCSGETVAWSSARGLSGDNTSLSSIHDALNYGFELSWKRTFLCRECEASHGNCFGLGDGFTCSHRCYDDTGMDLPLPCSIHYYGGTYLRYWNAITSLP